MSKAASFRLLISAALGVVLLLWVGSASAASCNVNTEPFWDGNITNGFVAQAQTFEAPSTSCNILLNWEFALAGRSTAGQVTFNIYEWGTNGPMGSALYSTVLNWGTTDAKYDVTNINLPLISGQLYGAEVDFQGYTGRSIYFQDNQTGYPGFGLWWYNGRWKDFSALQTYFQANFGSTVPEPGTLIMLGSGALGLAGVLRRKVL